MRLPSQGVTKDAAPVPHASLASRVSWPYKGRRLAVGSCRPAPG